MAHGYVVWWLEGFAEFMHYKQGCDAAVGLISSGKMSLSDVLATTSHDSSRIYRWGYLAVRFMMEEHPPRSAELVSTVSCWLGISRMGATSESAWPAIQW
ncbi:collagenase [Vibrio lentus]|nr:collagenase [Vibrio lentus]